MTVNDIQGHYSCEGAIATNDPEAVKAAWEGAVSSDSFRGRVPGCWCVTNVRYTPLDLVNSPRVYKFTFQLERNNAGWRYLEVYKDANGIIPADVDVNFSGTVTNITDGSGAVIGRTANGITEVFWHKTAAFTRSLDDHMNHGTPTAQGRGQLIPAEFLRRCAEGAITRITVVGGTVKRSGATWPSRSGRQGGLSAGHRHAAVREDHAGGWIGSPFCYSFVEMTPGLGGTFAVRLAHHRQREPLQHRREQLSRLRKAGHRPDRGVLGRGIGRVSVQRSELQGSYG